MGRGHAIDVDTLAPHTRAFLLAAVESGEVELCRGGERLDSLRFGPGWTVLDLHDAPPTADVVLTAPVNLQLTHRLTAQFPQAQISVTGILDPQLGIDLSGPAGRMLDAGAHAYLPPRPLAQVAENVHAVPSGRDRAPLDADRRHRPSKPPTPGDGSDLRDRREGQLD